MQNSESLLLQKKAMGTATLRNWGYLFLTSILLAVFMLVRSYTDFNLAEEECGDCFSHEYDYLKNEVIPIFLYWLGGLLAATVFHHFVTPSIVRHELGQKFGVLAFLSTFLGLGLILAAALAYGYFNIDLFRYDYEEGPTAFPYFRTLHVVQDSVKLLVVIVLYEMAVETYVFLTESAKKNGSVLLKALSEFLLGFFMLAILWYAISLTREVVYGKLDCTECDTFALVWYWIIPLLLLHLHWFYRGIDIVKRNFTPENRMNFLELVIVPAATLVYFILELQDAAVEVYALNFLAVHVLGIGSAFLRSILVTEKRSFLTEFSQTSAELGALRAQINPHFLFNALNTLYAIAMKENSEKTADGIQKLGDMMRFMLQENHQNRIPLAKEIEYLHNLIDIQQLRLDDNQQIDLKINLQNPDRDVFIAPMLLNPLVENAFKHGISFRNASWIYITLTHDPEHIFFKVHNSYHPKSELDPEKDSHGIGLDNVRKRLELLYPDKHEFSIQVSEHDYFVSLILTIV